MAYRKLAGVTKTLNGNAQQLSTTSVPGVICVVFDSPSSNSNNIVEDMSASIDVANGSPITPGKQKVVCTPEVNGTPVEVDLANWYVKGTNGESLKWEYWVRY